MGVSDQPPQSSTEGKPAPRGRRPARRGARSTVERAFVRLFATVGIVGIGVGVGAILGGQKVQGWIIGLVVAVVSIVLAALLSGSRLLRREG